MHTIQGILRTDLLITPMFPSGDVEHKFTASCSHDQHSLNAPLRLRLENYATESHAVNCPATHLMTRAQNDLESPKQYMDNDRPNNPMRMTGFRPTRSDIRLQCSTVIACVRKNNDSLYYMSLSSMRHQPRQKPYD